jgi:dolichol-phosphate mannosyltransferase
MMNIDVICPVFREEESIVTFHNTLLEAIAPLAADYSFRFIYVVDPSPDKSEALLCDLGTRDSRISVIVMSRRFGHQAALIAGLDASTADAAIMLDSDMQHPPSLIPTLIRHWRTGADIVQALRQDDNESSSLGKRMTSVLFYRLFTYFARIDINSGAADYRLLSRDVVGVFRNQLREHNPFRRGLITWVGYKIVYVHFTPEKRFAGRSNYSLSALGIFALNGLCSFSKLPLRICMFFGFVFAIVSMIGAVVEICIHFFIDRTYAPGWASLFALLAFASSINLFFLGVLGEYIGLIFDEVKDRPRYLIARTYGTLSIDNIAKSIDHRRL